MSRWNVITETDEKPDPMLIPYKTTPQDRDTVAIVKCDIAAMQRRFRQPEGLEVGEATWEQFTEAREAFRKTL